MSQARAGPLDVLVVSHTHWDREWYHTAGRFRQQLVQLMDELLDHPPANGESFLLDGQAVVAEDYLSVRPERAAELSELLRSGALEAGPWYVLADELIPGAESLVRNLLAGRRVLRGLRAQSPPVLYCPDSFGHPASLPTLATGFDLPVIVLWRGLGGARPSAPAAWVRWRAPDGSQALVYHLPRDGYGLGAGLPSDASGSEAVWPKLRAELVEKVALGLAVLPHGADHHARARDHTTALAALEAAARPDRLVRASLAHVAREAQARAGRATLAEIAGELRDSYGYTWTLQGTLGSRAHQKRRAARVERRLLRDTEPWAMIASRVSGTRRQHLAAAAWRELLLCHPHDTLCGCSIDAVARAMDARLDDASAQAEGLRRESLFDVIGHDAVDARGRRGDWSPVLVVRNRAARSRGGVAEVELLDFVRDVPVGPGSAPDDTPPVAPPEPTHVFGAGASQLLSRDHRTDRTESPAHYPDNDLVQTRRAVIWIDPVDGYGTRTYPLKGGPHPRDEARIPNPVRGDETSLTNGRLTLEIDASGRISLRARGGEAVTPLLRLDDQRDLGDLYTPSLRGQSVVIDRWSNAKVVHRGPLRGRIEGEMRVPRTGTSGGATTLRVAITLDANAAFAKIHIDGMNRSRDHRLRAVVSTGVSRPAVFADAAFGPVRREPIRASESARAMETPPPTAPLHRYVTLAASAQGTTVFSDGLAEYEANDAGDVAITLVRAVAELSRNDLPERPGHAGWPEPVPGAQCLGRFAATLAVMPHGARTNEVIDRIEQTADDVLLPLTGTTLRSAIGPRAHTRGIELAGTGLAFSCAKESDNGQWCVVRCVNLTDQHTRAKWRFGFDITEARLARLDESPLSNCEIEGNAVSFAASPRGVVTVLVR